METCLPPKLVDLLGEYDMYGLVGAPWMTPRNNLLMGNVSIQWDDDNFFLLGQHMIPEGSSKQMFINRCFPGLADTMNSDIVKVSCQKPIDIQLTEKVLLWNVRDSFWECSLNGLAWEIDEHTVVLPVKVPSRDKLHILEMFSGGYAGWKHASRLIKDLFHVQMQTVAIDSDLDACKYYAMSHDALLLDAFNSKLPMNLDSWKDDFVLHCDVENDDWLPAICNWGVHLLSISAPCPPWSGASKGTGLFSDQGCLLPAAIMRCRQIRPLVVMLEQVNAFATHQHKNLCIDALKHVGYQVIFQRVVDSAGFGGVTRLRWLAIAVARHADQIQRLPFQMWPDMGQFNMDMLDALFTNQTIA